MAGTWTELWDPDRGWVKVYISFPDQEHIGLITVVNNTADASPILEADGDPLPTRSTRRIGFLNPED